MKVVINGCDDYHVQDAEGMAYNDGDDGKYLVDALSPVNHRGLRQGREWNRKIDSKQSFIQLWSSLLTNRCFNIVKTCSYQSASIPCLAVYICDTMNKCDVCGIWLLRQEPALLFCLSLVKSERTWLRPEELDTKQKKQKTKKQKQKTHDCRNTGRKTVRSLPMVTLSHIFNEFRPACPFGWVFLYVSSSFQLVS